MTHSPRFSPREKKVIRDHRTPRQVQRYLRSLPYNWRHTLWTFRNVVRHRTASCLEAALAAATILEQHGHPPLLLDLESVDHLDHVVFLFKTRRGWGSIGKSRDVGLHGRKPVFRTVRDLAYSYVDPYVDGSGRIIGYGVGDLRELTRSDWRLSTGNVWAVERALIRMPHTRLRTSDRRHERMLRRFTEFKKRCPDRPFLDYEGRERWM